MIREASSGGGRMVTCLSPAEHGPGDAPAGVAVDAPVLRAGDCCHDVESVGAAVFAGAGAPWASGVCYFDPDVVRVDFGAEGEFAAVAGGAVQDRVGGVLRRDQDGIVGARAVAEQGGERGPGVPDLGGVSGVGTGVAARACRRGCRRHLSLPEPAICVSQPVWRGLRWEQDRSGCPLIAGPILFPTDRKSTRLNSSHLVISYAV